MSKFATLSSATVVVMLVATSVAEANDFNNRHYRFRAVIPVGVSQPDIVPPQIVDPRVADPRVTVARPALPVFGMDTINHGWGDQIVSVRPGGVAWRLGLEPGDTILRLNGYPLNCRGAWWTALGQAMDRGGFVQLTVRDVRSGRIVLRQTTFPCDGGVITPRYDQRDVAPYAPPVDTRAQPTVSRLERRLSRLARFLP